MFLSVTLFACFCKPALGIDAAYHAAWQIIPIQYPASIHTEAELDAVPNLVSPVLGGGLGSIMFKIAGAASLAKERGLDCIIAWWDQDPAPAIHYQPFAGRGEPAPGITLKHIFPNIRYADFNPANRNMRVKSLKEGFPGTHQALPDPLPSPFLDMYFYDPERYFSKQHDFVVNELFQFHPAMVEYVHTKYDKYLKGPKPTVSVHFRLGGNDETEPAFFDSLRKPLESWYEYVMFNKFNRDDVVYLLFTDDIGQLNEMLDSYDPSISFEHVIVEEDYATSLLLMTMCTHHVGSFSTYSYWGAYLDTKQSIDRKVYFPHEFYQNYGFLMMMQSEWVTPPPEHEWMITSSLGIPPGMPPLIRNDKQLDALGSAFVSPIMLGGFGNNMFQMAACHALAIERNRPCIIAWWDQGAVQGNLYTPFQGRTLPNPNMTLKNIFPYLNYVDYFPWRDVWRNPFKRDKWPPSYDPFPVRLKSNFIHGFFFDSRYFHKHRSYLVDSVFQFHPSLVEHVTTQYHDYLHGDRTPVSLHFRLGGAAEVDKDVFNRNKQTDAAWYLSVITTQFDLNQVMFLVFSDDIPVAVSILQGFNIPSMKYVMIDDDFVNSMLLMSLCTHHICAPSTFSYWGAYLDQKQPTGGKTIFPPEFEHLHHVALPFAEWIVYDTEDGA